MSKLVLTNHPIRSIILHPAIVQRDIFQIDMKLEAHSPLIQETEIESGTGRGIGTKEVEKGNEIAIETVKGKENANVRIVPVSCRIPTVELEVELATPVATTTTVTVQTVAVVVLVTLLLLHDITNNNITKRTIIVLFRFLLLLRSTVDPMVVVVVVILLSTLLLLIGRNDSDGCFAFILYYEVD